MAEFKTHEDRVCLFCNKTFRAESSHVKRGGGKYCSRKCSAAALKTDVEPRIEKRAHSWVFIAIREGRLKKQPCEICGAKKVYAHHPDYSKPLEVIWLCQTHHMEEHKRMNGIIEKELEQERRRNAQSS